MNTADANREHALINIRKKIRALQMIATNTDHESSIQEYYPKTIRQFNLWDLKQNSERIQREFPQARKNANSTLTKYKHLIAEIKTIIAALQAKSTPVTKRKKTDETIKTQAEYIAALEDYTALQKLQLISLHETMTEEVSRLNRIIEQLKCSRDLK